jgi:hypothetical protein
MAIVGLRNQHGKKSGNARRKQASCPIRGHVHWHDIEASTYEASMTQQFFSVQCSISVRCSALHHDLMQNLSRKLDTKFCKKQASRETALFPISWGSSEMLLKRTHLTRAVIVF